MSSVIKLVIGLVVVIAGILWYAAPRLGLGDAVREVFGINAGNALTVVFVGLFGLFLIFIGFIVAWIEYEDLKWQRRERQNAKK